MQINAFVFKKYLTQAKNKLTKIKVSTALSW